MRRLGWTLLRASNEHSNRFDKNPHESSARSASTETPLAALGSSIAVSSAHSPQHLLIRLLNPPQILPEAILIHGLPRGHVPEPAGVRRDLVGEDQLVVVDAELQLEIHQQHLPFSEERRQKAVGLERQVLEIPH